MKKQRIWFVSFFVLFFGAVNAQKSYQNEQPIDIYTKGVLAFENENYALSQYYFSELGSVYKGVNVYRLLCALEEDDKHAGQNVAQYLKEHPFGVYKTNLVLALANYYFRKRKIATAFKWFQQIDVKNLTAKQEANYNYKQAFASYRAKKYTEAKQYLLPISKEGAYKNEANYYLANIAMQTKDYSTALTHLEAIKSVSKYQNEIAYDKLVILFDKEEYRKAVEFGEIHYNKATGLEKSEMAKIIGESYFYIERYKKALEFLSAYKGRRNKYTETDYYFLGYTLYQLNKYEEAIQKFNKITDEKSKVAQNAHYHLGDCYLSLDQKTQALNAFKNASEMSFDVSLQKDAFLNYAKLSYEIGNPYKSSSLVLQDFVNAYPNAKESDEIKALIINAYLEYKDFDGAIDYYKTQGVLKDKTYQLIVLQKGFELFEIQKYNESLPYFREASEMYLDAAVKNKALFWRAETLAEMNRFKEASYHYLSFINNKNSKEVNEYKDGIYGLAYSLFQQKKYKEALAYFEKYILTSQNALKKNNAELRVGDCYYVTKNYEDALISYQKVIDAKIAQVDYAIYQKALAYGFLGKNQQKKEVLLQLQKEFLSSAYLDKSYYQLGNLYVHQGDEEAAVLAYDNLINRFPKSSFVAKTQVKKGLVFFNSGKNEEALSTLKTVVANSPGTQEAVQAVKIAEQVYKELDEVEAYAAWVKTLEFVNISDAEIDKTMFEALETRYLSRNLRETITSGKKYLANFPNGIYALNAHFYVAQAYFNLDEKQKSIPYYSDVLQRNVNEYSEISTNRLSQVYLENEAWDLASPLLIRLENESSNVLNVVYAQSNLMKYYFVKKEYTKALAYTYKVLDNEKSSEQAVTDAYVYGARSSIFTNELGKAKEFYQKLETLGKGEVLAEANYYKALWLRNSQNYKASNAQVQILASKYQNYKYWGIKGLLLMAQNFHELKDDFQASFILKNIIENSEEFPESKKAAEELLVTYKLDKQEVKSSEEPLKEAENVQ